MFLIAIATLEVLADAAAGQGLLMVVDDVHWIDDATAQVLGFVARRIESEPIALLAAARPGSDELSRRQAFPSGCCVRCPTRRPGGWSASVTRFLMSDGAGGCLSTRRATRSRWWNCRWRRAPTIWAPTSAFRSPTASSAASRPASRGSSAGAIGRGRRGGG